MTTPRNTHTDGLPAPDSALPLGLQRVDPRNGPVREGKLLTPAQFNALPRERQDAAKVVIEELNHRLKGIIETLHGWQEESTERESA
jgi:hypothetical protein